MQGPILGANEASSPYAGCTGLHFDSTTAALLALTTINKCLVFLEREKSIGRLLSSRATNDRFPMTREELKIGKALLLGSRAAELFAVFVLLGEKLPWRSDMTRFS